MMKMIRLDFVNFF
jgi:hypothetical protein